MTTRWCSKYFCLFVFLLILMVWTAPIVSARSIPRSSVQQLNMPPISTNHRHIWIPGPHMQAPTTHKANASAVRDQKFVELCRSGSPEEIKRALAEGANPNARDTIGNPGHEAQFGRIRTRIGVREADGETALMAAVRRESAERIKVNVGQCTETSPAKADQASRKTRTPEAVALLLAAGADVNAKDWNGQTALMLTADAATVHALLTAGADVNAKDENDRTALLLTVWERDGAPPDAVRMLLAAGANPDIRDKDGETALIMAAGSNCSDGLVTPLLAAGADVNAQNKDGATALMKAAYYNRAGDYSGTVRALLAAGADVRARDKEGRTALAQAVQRGCDAAVRELLAVGADTGEDGGKTGLLWEATRGDDPETIKTLLTAGADVNAKTNKGVTALMMAVEFYNRFYDNPKVLMLKTLLDAGADANAADNNGTTALMMAIGRNEPSMVKALLDGGANANAETAGYTPLMWVAATNRDSGIITALLAADANVHGRDKNGWTPLMLAAFGNRKSTETVRRLLTAGADVNAKANNGATALMLAVEFNDNPEILKELLNAGADVNAQDGEKMTALMLAARYNSHKAVAALLEKGANKSHKDQNGHDALWHAQDSARKGQRRFRHNLEPKVIIVVRNINDVIAEESNGRRIRNSSQRQEEDQRVIHILRHDKLSPDQTTTH